MDSALILIQCQDQIGLVSRISGIIVSHNLNIDAMREFVDANESLFFARLECSGKVPDSELLGNELVKHLPVGAMVIVNPVSPKKMAILVTKEYHCLGDILVRNYFNSKDIKVCCVLGNHSDLQSFAEGFLVPFHHVSNKDKSKEDFEKEMSEILKTYEPDYLVLAKFMQILSPDFVAQYPNHIINIHHSFLPAFAGAHPYRQAFERGVKLIGATAHFVTGNLDEGPIITQQTITIDHTYTVDEMVKAGQEVEKAVLNKAISLISRDKVFTNGNKTIVFE
ncbi:MAG TPA: formyltetrahydrofolate deformylase [Hanamia sp.]|nr:formyltetrahydrofolate deformylase [Hanamia sp.]